MKFQIDVYLKNLKRKINRKINVNDKMTLKDFCEYIIVAMNGNCKHLYQLILNEEECFLGPGCYIKDFNNEHMMDDLHLTDLELTKNDELMLNYDFRVDWEIMIKIKNVASGYYKHDFEVVGGCGNGILEGIWSTYEFKNCISSDLSEMEKNIYCSEIKNFDKYLNKKFNVDSINDEINNYINNYRELIKPKRYLMTVSLEGFEKEIKRKISIDSNVNLDTFCRGIISSMRGDLSHPYGIKIGKEYVEDYIIQEQDLNYLELKEKQKMKVIYDYGDNWVFNITINKILNEYGYTRRFEVLSGKGYGIIDDCGGTFELYNIFNKTNMEWGNYDITNFDIDKINKIVDCYI